MTPQNNQTLDPNSDAHRDVLTRALRLVDTAEKPHRARVERYRQRYRAYRGVLETKNDRWESQLHPPYAGNIVEILFSNLVDEHPRSRVIPAGPREILGAKAFEKILAKQRSKDKFDQKIRPWIKQALIMGVSPAKVSWNYRRSDCTYRELSPLLGGGFEMVENVKPIVHSDQPTFDPLPAEDFWWDPAALRWDQVSYCCARFWTTRESLMALSQAIDPNNPYMNVEEIGSNQGSGGAYPMTDQYIQVDRKNRVEVIELWQNDHLTTIANRKTVLYDGPNPFWHQKLPFVLANTMDDLYSLEGISEVDLVLDIQAALWEFLNQTIDNTRLLNNAIIMARDTIDDPDKLRFAPGELWLVADPAEVQMWTPNHNVVNSSYEMMGKLKEELQNLTGAVPYLSGAADGTVDQNTATGISVIQNMAARRITTKRNVIYACYGDISRMWMQLNQQFLTKPEAILIDGEDGFAFEHVLPEDIQGEYDYEVEDANESLNKQQARAEATNFLNELANIAPLAAQFGAPLNLKPAIESFINSFDKKNVSEYFASPLPQGFLAGPPAAGAGAPTTGQPAGPPAQQPPLQPSPVPPFGGVHTQQ